MRGRSIVLHDGSTAGFAGYIAYDPARQRGLVVLSNSNYLLKDFALNALQPAFPLVPRRTSVRLAEAKLRTATGTYGSGDQAANVFTYGDRIFVERREDGLKELSVEAADRFFLHDARPVRIDPKARTASFYRPDGTAEVLKRTGSARAPFVNLAAGARDRFCGTYQIENGPIMAITCENGRVYARVEGQSAFEIMAKGSERFSYLELPLEIEFKLDNGAPSKLIIHQDGEQTPATLVRSVKC